MPSLRPGRYSYTLDLASRLLHLCAHTLAFCQFSLQIRAKWCVCFFRLVCKITCFAMHLNEYYEYVWQCAAKQINIQLSRFLFGFFYPYSSFPEMKCKKKDRYVLHVRLDRRLGQFSSVNVNKQPLNGFSFIQLAFWSFRTCTHSHN